MTAEDVFRPFLASDERLLWTGRPVLGPSFWDRYDMFFVLGPPVILLLFSLAFDHPLRPVHFWGPAIVVACNVLFMAILKPVARRRWQRKFYAVSNRRIFIAGGTSPDKIACLPLEHVCAVSVLSSDRNNAPNVNVQSGTHAWLRPDGSQSQQFAFSQYLSYLPDAQNVRDLIQRAKQDRTSVA